MSFLLSLLVSSRGEQKAGSGRIEPEPKRFYFGTVF